MRRWLMSKLGLRESRKGQTTVEYAIIVSLVALASFSIILIFGDQIRALFAAGAKRMASDEAVTVEDKSSDADDHVDGTITEF